MSHRLDRKKIQQKATMKTLDPLTLEARQLTKE